MTRTSYDSADWLAVKAIARPGDLVLGYTDRTPPWPAEAWDYFKAEGIVAARITIHGDPGCAIGDVETGAMTIRSAPHYIRQRRAGGHRPTIYVDDDNLPKLRKICTGLEYFVFDAHWTGVPHISDGSIGTQWLSTPTHDVGMFREEFYRWHETHQPRDTATLAAAAAIPAPAA